MKKYCLKCGSATEFSFTKPKFCTNCGNSFEIGLAVELKSNNPKKIIGQKPFVKPSNLSLDNDNFEDDYDGEDVKDIPNISQIDCDYEVRKHEGIKFKKMIDNPMPSLRTSNAKTQKAKGKKLSKKEIKEFLDEFKKESGSIRPKK